MASRISGCTPALLSVEKPRAGLIEVFSIAQQCNRVQSGMTLEPCLVQAGLTWWLPPVSSSILPNVLAYVGFHVQETSQLCISEPSGGGDGGQRSNAGVFEPHGTECTGRG